MSVQCLTTECTEARPNTGQLSPTAIRQRLRECYAVGRPTSALRLLMELDKTSCLAIPDLAHLAAEAGDLRSVRHLFRRGVDVQAVDRMGRSLGHLAAQGEALDVLKLWVEEGGNLQQIDDRGESLLHAACRGGRPDLIEWLVVSGAPINRVSTSGETALHVALAHECSYGVVLLLCAAGIDVDRQDYVGDTALHLAVELGLVRISRVLMQAGADPTYVNSQGRTPDQLLGAIANSPEHQRCIAMVVRQRWSFQLLRSRPDS